MIARKINSLRMHDHNRLVGGADVPEEPKPAPEPEPEPKAETEPANALSELDTKISQPPPLSDLPSTPVQDTVQDTVQSEVEAKDSENKQPSPTSGPCCVCISQTPGLVR